MWSQKFCSCASAASLAAAIYFALCAGGATAASVNGMPPPPAHVKAADAEQGGASDNFVGTLAKTEKDGGGAPALLRAVRTSRRAGYDRVVFEFDGASVPGYRVEYVGRPAVRQCGSGEAVRVAGSARLRVHLAPANAHTESGEATVQDRARRLSYPNLKELKILCDFEAEVEWVLGLSTRARYRVLELRNPTRLVVDVKRR